MKDLRVFSPLNVLYLVIHGALLIIGYLLTASKSPLVFAIGTSLIAAGVTGWAVFVHIFISEARQKKIRLFDELRIEAFFRSRGPSIKPEYDVRIARVCRHIDVLGFGQRALVEDYLVKFPDWKKRASVRILLLDPEYPVAENSVASLRDHDEGDNGGDIARDVRTFISQAGGLFNEQFQVRLYRCLPTVNLFRIDDDLFWGPYLIRRVSRNSPTFVVNSGGVLFTELMDHFETIWSSDSLSRKVPKEWLAR